MKRFWKKLVPAKPLWGQAALFLLCSFAMVLAFTVAPTSRHTKHSHIHSARHTPPLIRGRSRKVFLEQDHASAPGPRLVRFRRSRQSSLAHLVFDTGHPFIALSEVQSRFWAPPRYDFSLPSASHPVFTPPIRL